MALAHEPSILLLGGGYTLERLAERLPAGHFVITSRSEHRCDEWRTKGWLAARVSLEEPTTIEQLFAQYKTLTTLIDSVPPLRGDEPAAGVRNLATQGIERVLYLSTTGVFGRRDGSLVTENTPPAPWNKQGAARLLCEEAYRASGVARLALRLPAIYGPGRGTLKSLRSGTYRFIESGDNWTNRIHVDDLVEVLYRLLDVSDWPPVLCVGDDEPVKAKDMVAYLCERYALPMPSSLSRVEAEQQGLFTMLSNQRVDNTFMKQLLGLRLKYPSYLSALEDGASGE